MYRSSFIFVAFLTLLSFSGCQRMDLHHNLEEIEADELLVILHQNGIDARKEKEVVGQDVSWKISVKEADGAKARQILIANNLPHRKELGLSGVYKEKGLIPTPDEQKARYLLALKGEIINSLHKIPGVVDVDVVLNVPNENEFAEMDPVKKRPTASVVVKTKNDADVAQNVTEGKLQKFVANTVPNLDPNDVTVIVSRTDTGASPIDLSPRSPVTSPPPSPGEDAIPSQPSEALAEVAGLRIDEGSVGRFKFYIVTLLFLLMGVSGLLLYNIMKFNRVKRKVQKGTRVEPMPSAIGGSVPSAGLLGEGAPPPGMEGTFDVNSSKKQF